MKSVAICLILFVFMAIHLGGAPFQRAEALTEDFKLTASDAAAFDIFGEFLSVSGNVIAVGAYGDDDAGDISGSAYVYRFKGASWVEEAKLTASDASEGDHFSVVSVSGDVIVVGASGNDDAGNISGSAYVYRFDGADWVEEAKLTASDASEGDAFGESTSVSNDVIVIGAYEDDHAGTYSGSAYAYRFNGADWIEEAKLTASDAGSIDRFGNSVSVSGNVIVIGAFGHRFAGIVSGAAYVYRFNGADWVEEAMLTASDAAQGDNFGYSVSVNGDVIVVGAYGNDDAGASSGSAYVYRFDGADWVEEAKLTASNGTETDLFGVSVSVSGNVVVVGAERGDSSIIGSGSAYLYGFDGTDWVEKDILTATDIAARQFFGRSVSVDGKVIAVGATLDRHAGANSGSVYVYGSPCIEPTVVHGVIDDRNNPRQDAFSIKLKNMTGIDNALTDFDNKTVHIEVGQLVFEIPGDRFVHTRKGVYAYYGSLSNVEGAFLIVLRQSGRATLTGVKTILDGITNPIQVTVGIEGACWQSTIDWREFSYSRGIMYRFP